VPALDLSCYARRVFSRRQRRQCSHRAWDAARRAAPRPPACPRAAPSYTTWRSRLSSVQVRNFTSATSSGRTQCTRPSTGGDPKRLVRGGGTSSGIVSVAKRLQAAPQPLKLGGVDAGAGAAGIDQPAARIIVGEQQRAEIRPPAFGIGPAHHHKFLAVQASDLEPQAAVAGRVGGIGAFRDNAFKLQLAGLRMERRAPAAVIVTGCVEQPTGSRAVLHPTRDNRQTIKCRAGFGEQLRPRLGRHGVTAGAQEKTNTEPIFVATLIERIDVGANRMLMAGGAAAVVIDPDARNHLARRAYTRAGFVGDDEHAEAAAVVFKEDGALKLVECWGDDVPEGKLTSFPLAVQRKDDETVVFSWIIWPSRKVRDEAMPKVMADPRLKPDTNPMPFDGKRLIYGGSEMILDT
jgi:uncharacterized protein YbaA (DUF1428 family)